VGANADPEGYLRVAAELDMSVADIGAPSDLYITSSCNAECQRSQTTSRKS
jgi:hypothetical protein